MWWKLVGLVALTAAFVFAVIPFRTHAVVYDPLNEAASKRASFIDLVSNMYLTPGTVLLILCILAAASFVGFKVIRGHR